MPLTWPVARVQWLTGSTSFNIAGLAVASDERIKAYLLYVEPVEGTEVEGTAEIVSLRTFIEDGGARLKQLLSQLRAQGTRTFRLPKVHPAEISTKFDGDARFPPRRSCVSASSVKTNRGVIRRAYVRVA